MGIETAIIGSAILGAGASMVSGSQQAKAAKKAGQAQQQASSEALKLQREQMARSFDILSKYGASGDWARNQQAAFLGAPQVASTANRGNPNAAPGQPNYQKYLSDNPDVAQAFANDPNAQRQFGGDANAYAKYHYETYGKNEGRQAPGAPAASSGDEFKTPDQLRDDAMANYEASPWAKIAATSADDATKEFTSMAGAQGSALSGRTARGMAEVSNREKQKGFGTYYGALGDVADTGFAADTGIASAGQTFADRSGSALMNGANATANAQQGQADAWGSALTDAAGWAGWATGNLWDPAGKGGGNTSQTTFKGPTQAGRKTSGGFGRIM